jgi:hypothetical protein
MVLVPRAEWQGGEDIQSNREKEGSKQSKKQLLYSRL